MDNQQGGTNPQGGDNNPQGSGNSPQGGDNAQGNNYEYGQNMDGPQPYYNPYLQNQQNQQPPQGQVPQDLNSRQLNLVGRSTTSTHRMITAQAIQTNRVPGTWLGSQCRARNQTPVPLWLWCFWLWRSDF